MRRCHNCDHNLVCNNKDNYIDCLLWSGWHDLKENPNDLPNWDKKYVLIKNDADTEKYKVATYWDGVFIYKDCYKHNVIAWREVPEFE